MMTVMQPASRSTRSQRRSESERAAIVIGSAVADFCGLLIALGAAYWLLAAGSAP